MSSKKATFESKDPLHGSDQAEGAVAKRKSRDEPPAAKYDPEPRKLAEIDFATGKPLDSKLAERPSFYTRDPDLGESSLTTKEDGKYTGVERRKGGNRRSGGERRTDVRFELEKKDRRESSGRRKDDETPDYW